MNAIQAALNNPQLQVRRVTRGSRNKLPLIVARPWLRHANTITNLIPLLYQGLDVVSRELVGFIAHVNRDSSAERAALNQTINIFAAPAASTGDITPGTNPPDDGDQTMANTTMTISRSKYSPVRWAGEEQKAVSGSGQSQALLRDQFVQSMRALVNLVEADLAGLHVNASRAYGTPGTAPFGTASDLTDMSMTRQILDDNGAPQTDLKLVLGSAAIANLRGKQSVLFKVNEAGTDELLRNGILGRLEGQDIGNSAQVVSFTKGTGSAYTTSAAGFAVGATSIAIITGTGTVLAGDTVTFAGDTNKYVVATGVAAPGTIVLAAPGLRQAIPAAATAMTIGNSAARNMAFSKSALHLVTRAPAMPEGGDEADDVMEITDPHSGLAFQVALYRQYRRIKYEVGLAWGYKCSKPEHVALLLG